MTDPITQRFDDYGSLITEVAAGNTRQFGTSILNLGGGFGARWAYAQGGLMARIIDIPADTATARGVTIEGCDEAMANELERLNVLSDMSDGLRWSLLDGGGALLVLAEDGATIDQPLDPGKLIRIQEFRVLSAVNIRGNMDDTYTDPNFANYGTPRTYYIDGKNGARAYLVHESRLITIPGGPTVSVAGGADVRGVPWAGRGVAPSAVRAIERYRRVLNWAEKLLERSQQAVHGMKGLASMLMAGQEPVVRKRIDLVDGNRNAMNGVAVDSEDTYTITSASSTGVKDTVEAAEVSVAAETGFPVTILFGRSPGGLNATGDSDWAVLFDMVDSLRKKRLSPAMERAVSLILAQKQYDGDKPDDWHVVWPELAQLSEKERTDIANKQADTRLKEATALEKLAGIAALSQDEAHAWLAERGEFGLEPLDTDGGDGGARQYARET